MKDLKENKTGVTKEKSFRKRGKFTPKNKKNFEEKDSSKEVKHNFNDPLWYAKNEQMLKDAASYSYNAPVGSRLPDLFSGITTDTTSSTVPSLYSLHVLLTPGVSVDAASPVNLAANNIYAYVRFQNSGAKNYDQADLMLYLLAMDSLYACWNWLKRIYGYISLYSQYNKTIPQIFADADNIDFESFSENLAELRLFLNRTAAQISSFCVPAVMPFFIRHSWMFSNIYKDSDNNKAQMYMFNPNGFYKYSETSSQFGGELNLLTIQKDNNSLPKRTFDNVRSMFESMINAVSYSEDIGIMSGDILKAYGAEKLFKLTPVEPEYTVIPVYNEEVLNQIHNSTIVPYTMNVTDLTPYSIKQDPNTGFLKWKPSAPSASQHGFYLKRQNFMVNMPWDDVTPSNTMVGTRLIAAFEMPDVSTAVIKACGTEIITRHVIWFRSVNATPPVNTDRPMTSGFLGANTSNYKDTMALMVLISQFDWHPLMPILKVGTTQSDYEYLGNIGDVTNYTTMSIVDIEKLHLTAIMSEFNIPQLGAF